MGDSSAIAAAHGNCHRRGGALSDVFIRIKAIEALGRMKAASAATPLRNLVRNRSGLTYAEPAGLRSAAEDALALIEDRAGSLSLRHRPRPRRLRRPPLRSRAAICGSLWTNPWRPNWKARTRIRPGCDPSPWAERCWRRSAAVLRWASHCASRFMPDSRRSARRLSCAASAPKAAASSLCT